MIYTERKVSIKNDKATIDSPIILFRGDREVEIMFTIVDSKFKFESNKGNVIDKTQAAFGQLAVALPDGTDLFTEIVECENGVVVFSITGEMIDEVHEVGFYSFHIRLYNDDKSSRITLPPVMEGIEIREPLIIEGDVENTDLVGDATVGYSMVQAVGTNKEVFDEYGNYIPTVWGIGDKITAEKLNKIEEGVEVANQSKEQSGTFDLEEDVIQGTLMTSGDASSYYKHYNGYFTYNGGILRQVNHGMFHSKIFKNVKDWRTLEVTLANTLLDPSGNLLWCELSDGTVLNISQVNPKVIGENRVSIDVPENCKMIITTYNVNNEYVEPIYTAKRTAIPEWLDTKSIINQVNVYELNNHTLSPISTLFEDGYYLSADGNHVANNTMGTAYFNVVEGYYYTMRVYNIDPDAIQKNLAIIYFWDSDDILIKQSNYEYEIVSEQTMTIRIKAPIGAVRGTTTYKTDDPTISLEDWQVYTQDAPFCPEWICVDESVLAPSLREKISPKSYTYNDYIKQRYDFKDKAIMCFGDSITFGVCSDVDKGMYTDQSLGYCKVFSDIVGASKIDNFAVSGSFICDNDPTTVSSIMNRVLNVTEFAEYVIIAGGVNDYSLGRPLGVLGDTGKDTFYGCLYNICEHLKTNASESTIIFISPINQSSPRANATNKLYAYSQAIYEMALSYNFNMINGSTLGFPTEPGTLRDRLIYDGIHPSELGHKIFANHLVYRLSK